MRLFVALCIAAVSSSAFADLYGYIDANGVEHFSTDKPDARYRVFMQNGMVLDKSRGARKIPAAQYFAEHPGMKKYEGIVHQAARENALNPAFLKAVMAAESAFNPAAVSPKGAIGLMQVMPATAQRYGLRGDSQRTLAQKLADPETNIRIAARYLHDLDTMFPSAPHLAIAAYNAGEGAVQKYANRIPPYPETINYVNTVAQLYLQFAKVPAQATSAEPIATARPVMMTFPGNAKNIPSKNQP